MAASACWPPNPTRAAPRKPSSPSTMCTDIIEREVVKSSDICVCCVCYHSRRGHAHESSATCCNVGDCTTRRIGEVHGHRSPDMVCSCGQRRTNEVTPPDATNTMIPPDATNEVTPPDATAARAEPHRGIRNLVLLYMCWACTLFCIRFALFLLVEFKVFFSLGLIKFIA